MMFFIVATASVDNKSAHRRQSTVVNTLLVLMLCITNAACSSGRDDVPEAGVGSTDKPLTEPLNGQLPLADGVSPEGRLAHQLPAFIWPAHKPASQYQLIIEDESGNRYQHQISAADAGCAGGGERCTATPRIGYPNQWLSWRVNAIVDDKPVRLTAPLSFSTPPDTSLLPVTDNAAVCDVWPTLAYGRYAVLNNIWNAGAMRSDDWQQTIAATQMSDGEIVASWSYDWLAKSRGTPHAVKAYPEVIYGNKLGTLISGSKEQTGLPERIDRLADFSIDYRYSETGTAERNVAIESFFHDSCEVTGPCHIEDNRAYEMMVWINNPETWKPGDLAVSDVEIDGHLWDVYIKPRSNKQYIAFTTNTPQTEGRLRWNRFVDWTVQWTTENAKALGISPMTPDLCMGAIEFGTELWSGKGTFTLEHLHITRN